MKAKINIEHDIASFLEYHWAPLEDILSACIEMIEQKRILANSVDTEFDGNREEPPEWEEVDELYSPWSMMQDFESIVDITISAWESLLTAIEARLPRTLDNEAETKYSVDACDLGSSFVKKFLQRARISQQYRYIAPGLRLATSEELPDQPFKKVDLSRIRYPFDKSTYIYRWFPFLFLRGDGVISATSGRYHGYPWDRCTSFSTGLYLHPTMNIERPDGCNLLLPFDLRTNWWVRFSSGEPLDRQAAYDGLYQPGSSILNSGYMLLRLELLFRNWKWTIENGHWTVDENGVRGGIDKFREADTEEKYNLYRIPRTW